MVDCDGQSKLDQIFYESIVILPFLGTKAREDLFFRWLRSTGDDVDAHPTTSCSVHSLSVITILSSGFRHCLCRMMDR